MRQGSDQKIGLPVAGGRNTVLYVQLLQNMIIRLIVFDVLFHNRVLDCATVVAIETQRLTSLGGQLGEKRRSCNARAQIIVFCMPNMIFQDGSKRFCVSRKINTGISTNLVGSKNSLGLLHILQICV